MFHKSVLVGYRQPTHVSIGQYESQQLLLDIGDLCKPEHGYFLCLLEDFYHMYSCKCPNENWTAASSLVLQTGLVSFVTFALRLWS